MNVRQASGCQGAETDKSTWGQSGKESITTAGQGDITPRTHTCHSGGTTTELSSWRGQGSNQREFDSNHVAQYLVGMVRGDQGGATHTTLRQFRDWSPLGGKSNRGDIHMAEHRILRMRNGGR